MGGACSAYELEECRLQSFGRLDLRERDHLDDIDTDGITYLLSSCSSPSCEANKFWDSQEIPRIYGTRRFITAFTSTR